MKVISKPHHEAPFIREAGVEPTPPKAGRGMGWLFPSCVTTKKNWGRKNILEKFFKKNSRKKSASDSTTIIYSRISFVLNNV